MPQLSILLPYLFADDAFQEAVESILQQSFTNWELLLICNGEEAERQKAQAKFSLPNIHHLYETKRGIAFALNTGLDFAKGKFIGRMDADDVSLPERFEKQVEHLLQYPEIAAVSCQTTFESDEPAAGYQAFVDWQNSLLTPEDHKNSRFQESPLAHPSVCFRKRLITNYGNYSTKALPEDYELWLRWMDAGENIEKLNFTGLVWKDHTDRLSRNHPNYSEEAFYRLKARYLLKECRNKTVLVCGSSVQALQRWRWMEDEGLKIDCWTDIHPKQYYPAPYLKPEDITKEDKLIVLSLIAQAGTREKVEEFFIAKGYQPGVDYFSCA